MKLNTHPDELDDGAELELLLDSPRRFDGRLHPRSAQLSHHLQQMTPVWCLDAEGHKPSSRQRDDIRNPTLEHRLGAADRGRVEPERCEEKEARTSITSPCSRAVPKDPQTPSSNCGSTNEFAVGPNARGPGDEFADRIGGGTGGRSFSSNGRDIVLGFPHSRGYGSDSGRM